MQSGTVTLIVSIALTACEFNGPCTTSVEPGLIVRVVDSVTGAPAAHGASGVAVDDEYQEALRNIAPDDPAGALLYGADEREGTYTVSVEKPGYQPWARGDVLVTADECHVRTVNLEARLIATP